MPFPLCNEFMTADNQVPRSHSASTEFGAQTADDAVAVDEIIDALRRHTGVDVREYRRSTIERRIGNRMISIASPSLESYARLIAHSPHEANALLERVSIKVSEFFRNAEVFALLQSRFLPALVDSARGRPLRIWSAGCGRGEEAWTLAMLLHDLRIDGFIQATDVDPSALSFARRAEYRVSSVGALPQVLSDRYLTNVAGKRDVGESVVSVDKSLHDLVQFSVHDLLSDAPAPGEGAFDLICCRNVLIYFQRTAQERTFLRLQRCLAPAGMLCVGEAEWPCGPSADRLLASAPRSRLFHHSPLQSVA